MKNELVVGYHDKKLKKILFHAGTGFYVSDVQSANRFTTKKQAKAVSESARTYFVSRGRRDVKLSIFKVSIKEV